MNAAETRGSQEAASPVPVLKNRTSNRKGKSNKVQRKREYLPEAELEKLMKAAGDRDRAMILLAYRHGFRVSELCSLEWSQVVDLDLWCHIENVSQRRVLCRCFVRP